MNMVKKNLRQNPPSSYNVGEKVFLRVHAAGGVKRGGRPLHRPLVHIGQIIEVKPNYRYKVRYAEEEKAIERIVPVDNITSLTRKEEETRQKAAKARLHQPLCMCDSELCKRQPANKCRNNVNAVCCRDSGQSCRFHGVEAQVPGKKRKSDPQELPYQRYNVKNPKEVTKVMMDLTKNFKTLMKSNKATNKKNLDMNIKNACLTYRQPFTPADGNCLFHAIADQLQTHICLEISHEDLRARVVEYLRTNSQTRNGTALSEWIVGQDWGMYLAELSQDGVWGDEIVLIAVSNMFRVEISIISSLPGDSIHILTPQDTDPLNIPTLLLGHLHEFHYYSLEAALVPTNTMRDGKKRKTDNETSSKLLVDPRVAAILDELDGLSRADVIDIMEAPLPSGGINDDFEIPADVSTDSFDGHTLLGINDVTRYWAASLAKMGKVVPWRFDHFWVSDDELAQYLEFRDDLQDDLRPGDFKTVIYLDIIVVYWLMVTGKLCLLKDSKRVEGSFLFLNEEEAINLQDFKGAMYNEWYTKHSED